MSENFTLSSASSSATREETNLSSKPHQNSLKKYQKELSDLSNQINALKQNLKIKYQELENLKADIADKKEIGLHLNRKLSKLNEFNINIPNFLIIGVQKGGTTWLHENLKKHPQILLPKGKKELKFFTFYQKKLNDFGLSYYLKHFNQFDDILQTDKPVAIGEATPGYFWSTKPARKWTNPPNKYFNDDIPGSVFNLLGSKLKILLCLRDPVERAISAYVHHIRQERINYKSQSIFDVGHLHGIIDMGFYSQHLNAWLEKFNLENFKILIYERDIQYNKQKTIEDICDFLEVDYRLYPTSINLNEYHNKGLQYRIDKDGIILIPSDGESELLVVARDEIKQLRKIYYEDYLSLQKITNLDLSEVWGFA